MDPVARHLQAAQGYLKLGLPLEANEEVDAIDSSLCDDLRILTTHLAILQALARWVEMESVARKLSELKPDDSQWLISLAYATRRAHCLEHALSILTQAVLRFQNEPIIHYNLACYEAQLNRLDVAREHLREAIKQAPACRQMALRDEDLVALHQELQARSAGRK